jgi:hypothetical protein
MSGYTIPPNNRAVGTPDPAGDMDTVANALIALGDIMTPTGDTTGAADYAAIQGRFSLGARTVVLGPGTFYINQPLTIPPYSALIGAPATSQVSQAYGGATIAVTSGFTGLTISDSGSVTLKAAIVLLGQTFGSYSTVSEEQKIRNIQIDGTNAPASVHGIQSYGRLQRVQMHQVLISAVTGDGVHHTLDVAGNQPDAWTLYKVFVRFNGGIGFSLRSADSTYIGCLCSNTTGIGWFVNTESNSKFYACRSEHAGDIGWGYVCVNSGNSSGGTLFQGCSTDQSTKHGFQIGGTINGITSFVHSVAVNLSGCVFRRDGANGGSGGGGYAGLYNANYGGQVTASGLTVWPGVNDNGSGTNSPQIGLLADSGSLMNVSAAYIQGATTAITDNSGGGINWDNSVVTATGTTGSPTINASPQIAAYQGTSLTLSGASNTLGGLVSLTNTMSGPASAPVAVIAATAGDRVSATRVSGDSTPRVQEDSNGKKQWSSGSASADLAIQRQAGGSLVVSTDGAAGTFQPVDPYGGGFGYFSPSSVLGHPNNPRGNYTNASDSLGVSGTVYLVAYYLPAGTQVTNVVFFTGTGTLKTGGTHGWYVLCDSGLTVRAVSADQTDAATVWGTASTSYSLAVLTSGSTKYTTTYSGLYYLGIMVAESAGSMPNLVTGAHMSAGVAGISPVISSPTTATGRTTPPAADGSVTYTFGSSDGTKNFLCWVT